MKLALSPDSIGAVAARARDSKVILDHDREALGRQNAMPIVPGIAITPMVWPATHWT